MLYVWMEPRNHVGMIMREYIVQPCALIVVTSGFLFVLFSFDSLVCIFVVCECEFYSMDSEVGGR